MQAILNAGYAESSCHQMRERTLSIFFPEKRNGKSILVHQFNGGFTVYGEINHTNSMDDEIKAISAFAKFDRAENESSILGHLKHAKQCIESLGGQLEKVQTPAWQYKQTVAALEAVIKNFPVQS